MRAGAADSHADDGHGSSTAGESSRSARLAIFLAVGSTLVCTAVLGTRTLTTFDLGYHLAYGEQVLATGRLVDHNPYLYSLPAEDLPPADRPAPGPASWYDETGRYRFPNANWLSQLAMAAVYGWGGIAGLCVLTSVLVSALSALFLLGSRRMGLTWTASAAGLLWFGLVAHSRFNLRPELFGYLSFSTLLLLLGPLVLDPKRAAELRPPQLLAVVGVQLWFVNLHSYWPLGLFLGGALAFECLVRSVATPTHDSDLVASRVWQRARNRSALLCFAMLLVSFANPWTWRLAALPFETLAYLRQHGIGDAPGAHPWSYILEFRQTLRPEFPDRVSDYAIVGMLGLVALAAATALLRRRWALLLLLIGMSAVALSMRRNVASAALAAVPLGLAALRPYGTRLTERWPALRGGPASVAVASALVVAAAAFTGSIITHRFYLAENQPMRFGLGLSRANQPIGAAEFLDEHLPDARVWCDMSSSSTLHFFTAPHREVPILSNTWAYPPSLLTEIRKVRSLERPVARLVTDYGAEAVVLRHEGSGPLFRTLAKHPAWELVHLEGSHALFARTSGAQAEWARDASLAKVSDTAAYVTAQREIDPTLASSLVRPGVALLRAGLGALAAETFEAVLRERPDWPEASNYLGLAYLMRALRPEGDSSADLARARDAFARTLVLDPGNEDALRNLDKLERHLGSPEPDVRSPKFEAEQGRGDPF
jgi:hypothetical protein